MPKLIKPAFIFRFIFLIFSLCLLTANAQNSFIILDNAAASISGTGYVNKKPAPTAYDSASGYIINTGTGSKVIYTAGENVNGHFDIYLEVSRAVIGLGTTPFSIAINDSSETVPIIEYGFSRKADKSDIYDKGIFLCLKNTELKSGDRITVTALPGFVFGTSSFLPCIGDIRLYKPDTKVATGYKGIIRPDLPIKKEDPLSGLKLVWVGSSVTYGQAAQGYSMADYLEEVHPALKSYKYAISGTTLVDDAPTAYGYRTWWGPEFEKALTSYTGNH